ncbi:hypothetical protein H6Y62_09010 [Staphylococcus lugdunensis]|nr:hypothetical protein H6Y62_09010 [Staphylococcus lugdunensis]
MKFYDEKTGNWVEIETKPIAEDVVRIMKENWLKTKGSLDCLLIEADTQYDDVVRVAIFYNTAQKGTDIVDNQENYKISLETHLKNIVSKLSNYKEFNLNEFVEKLQIYNVMPDTFNLNVQIEDSEGNFITVPKVNTITNNFDITNALIEEGSKLEVRYIYNDNPIEEYKYVKANQ